MIGSADRQMRRFGVQTVEFKCYAGKVYLMHNTGCQMASCSNSVHVCLH